MVYRYEYVTKACIWKKFAVHLLPEQLPSQYKACTTPYPSIPKLGKTPIMASLLAFGFCVKDIAGRFKAAKDLKTLRVMER